MNKQDMSKECGFKDADMYYARESSKITDEEFNQYWDNNCGKCLYMCEICMCGEE
jgi:hypothetical protein